jgi:7,8-dihydroneopterin aldolase/epimerase/oxygenase
MGKLFVEGMKFHAFHGCNPEEAKIGGHYLVDVTVDTDFTKPAATDQLSDAVDYVAIYDITKKEMSVRSHLIEQVAQRIYDSVRKQFPEVKKIKVKVEKLNPPIGGDAKSVSAIISK